MIITNWALTDPHAMAITSDEGLIYRKFYCGSVIKEEHYIVVYFVRCSAYAIYSYLLNSDQTIIVFTLSELKSLILS